MGIGGQAAELTSTTLAARGQRLVMTPHGPGSKVRERC